MFTALVILAVYFYNEPTAISGKGSPEVAINTWAERSLPTTPGVPISAGIEDGQPAASVLLTVAQAEPVRTASDQSRAFDKIRGEAGRGESLRVDLDANASGVGGANSFEFDIAGDVFEP